MTKTQLIATTLFVLLALVTCLTNERNVDDIFKELLYKLYELEKDATNNNNNNNNNIQNRDNSLRSQSNQLGCYPLNFYNSRSYMKNTLIFTNNVLRDILTQHHPKPSLDIRKFQLLAPEPYWSTPQIKRFHRVVMILKSQIAKLENPENILKVKKTIASLLDLPLREEQTKRDSNGIPVCIKAGELDKDTNTRYLCKQCLNDKRLPSNMFPRDHQEIVCSSSNGRCLYTYGKCVQKHRFVTVLRNTGKCVDIDGNGTLIEKWVEDSVEIRSSCECQGSFSAKLNY